jgi:L-threonylcarbamoyladenylate synthase
MDEALEGALERLSSGGVVAFPSETVWGMAACAASDESVSALRAWKGRDVSQPISLLVTGSEALARYDFIVSELAVRLIDTFWPGPLTLVLPCRHRFAPSIARADGAVGVRCSSHPLPRRLAAAAERRGLGLLTATSLNRSGEPPVSCETDARALCGSGPGAPWVIAGRRDEASAESSFIPPTSSASTVIDLTGRPAVILRRGAIGLGELRACPGVRAEDFADTLTGEKIG